MPSITVRLADQYGNKVIMPVCNSAKLFASIAGTKTLTKAALLNIHHLWYRILLQPVSADEVRFWTNGEGVIKASAADPFEIVPA